MSEFDFSDFLDALDGESFEERPVSVEELNKNWQLEIVFVFPPFI